MLRKGKALFLGASSKPAMFEIVTALGLASVVLFVVLAHVAQPLTSSHRSYWLKHNNKLTPESLKTGETVQECVSG